MLAAAAGQTKAVVLLLQRGADPNIRDFFGETALTLSLQRNRDNIPGILVKHGADVNVVVAHDESTPLTIARRMKQSIMCLRLKCAGARE
jgi:ankyrin repeat protein